MAQIRKRMARPTPVTELLAAVFRGTPAEQRLREAAIWQVWHAAVGEQIARRARPVAIRDGLLTVTVSNAPWMQQLTFLKKKIIDAINERLGEELVRDILLKAGRGEEPAKPEQPYRPRKRTLSPEERQQIEDEAAALTDPELRAAFVSLMTKHLSVNNGC